MGLADGMRVAVVGAGPAGAAFAGSLLASARAFGRRVDVTLYDGALEQRLPVPAILDSDARSRLAALGAPALARGAIQVHGVLVHAAGRSALLEVPPGGVWVLDGPGDGGGRVAIKTALVSAAVLRGAHLRPWRVEAIEELDERTVVRAQGSSEAFEVVAGAFGAASELTSRWMAGRYRPPPQWLGSHARVSWSGRDELVRVCVAPTEEVDLLALVPCGASAYVVAAGSDVAPRALAQALMVLARDRVLPSGVEVLRAQRVAMPAGFTKTQAHGSALAVGAAVFGSLLDPGLQGALVSGMRSAHALLELGPGGAIKRRLFSAHADLFAHARRQPRLLHWMRRAGPRGPAALARLVARGRVPAAGPPIFGVPALGSAAALSAMRLEAFKQAFASAFAPIEAPPPELPSAPLVYVVDDDPDQRQMLVDFLGERGAQVRAFDDEGALLEAAARERPRAILLDVVLRWVDGFSLCRALRRHPATARARVISMSGLSRRADRDAALAAGADAFLPKPIDLGELERLLADTRVLTRRPASRDGAAAR